ncbi:hypothetical protein HYDPIDRAFT_109530 [Hydnomerulius pinastri MD-312]|nr:hypothetical protein HYDPIDRAFT_109530 [Hydnomerulius pinastri MD-312]
MREIGASPLKRLDGSEVHTCPVLSDPNTGALITDSWVIAEYLDKTYPEKPVFPNNTQGLINAFDSAYVGLTQPAVKLVLLRSAEILNERSAEYFIRTRQEGYGEKIEEWSLEGPKRDAHWAIHENGYGTVNTWYEKSGKWLMGDTFSYADIIVATRLLWFKRVFREDEWKRVCSWHDGKWEKLLADVQKECNLA